MANILLLVHKKHFDLQLCRFLKNYHHVHLMTSDPMCGLFLETQKEPCFKLYKLAPAATAPQSTPCLKRALQDTELYRATSDSRVRDALEPLGAVYLKAIETFVRQHRIDMALTQEKVFLDVACLTQVAGKVNFPVCYLGSGFFRGETTSASLERLHLTRPDIWARRFAFAGERPVIPPVSVEPAPLPDKTFVEPGRIAALWQKARYQRNPVWSAKHPDLGPSCSLLSEFRQKRLQRKAKKGPTEAVGALVKPYAMLTLQGNEICHQVPNPSGIRDMEHLATHFISSMTEINRHRKNPFTLVIKGHPNRPGLISSAFRTLHPDVLFLSKYPIEPLLGGVDLLATFNSLTGFEALLKYKPVVTLAPTFYAQDELVYQVPTLERFAETLERAIHGGCNVAAVDRFSLFLRQHFDIDCPGFSRKNPSPEGFQRLASHIAGVLKFAQTAAANPLSWTPEEIETR